MNSKSNIHLPSIFFVYIILYMFWALLKEFSISETMYNIGVVFIFVYAFINLISKEWKASFWMEVFFLSIWCLLMCLAYNNSNYSLTQRTVSFFGIYMDSHARVMLYLFLVVVPGIIISSCYKYKSGKLFKIMVLLIIVTSLYFSVRAVIVFPDALRARRTTEYLGYDDILYGTPTYSIVYSVCLLIPWFLAKYSDTKGKAKWFYLCAAVGICIIVAISQFATALLASLLGIALYWLLSNEKTYGNLFRVITILILSVMLFVRGPWVWLFNSLSDAVTGTWSEKLSSIAVFFEGGGLAGDLATRASLYSDSVDAFFASPVFGMIFNDTGIQGGHSTMLDMLALVGIVGVAFFAVAVYLAYRRTKSFAKDRKYIAAVNAITVSYIFLACTKNLISALSVNFAYFVLIPMLFSMKESLEDEQVEKNNVSECNSAGRQGFETSQ